MDDAAGRFDWLVEIGGAMAPASAAGFAGFKLSPLFDLAPWPAMVGSVLGAFALAFTLIRSVKPEPHEHSLPAFACQPIEALDELLLDQVHEEPNEPLLLEDMLADPDPDSRVVRLFAPESMPTAGELQARIDRHLADVGRPSSEAPVQAPDASDALYDALDQLRRSLR